MAGGGGDPSRRRKGGRDSTSTRFAATPSWAVWVTLLMLAHAFRAVVRAGEHAHCPGPADLVSLFCHEIQRLFTTVVVQPLHDMVHRLDWSDWRRRHQARSRTSHYLRQATSKT